jgi:hypothetical protein
MSFEIEMWVFWESCQPIAGGQVVPSETRHKYIRVGSDFPVAHGLRRYHLSPHLGFVDSYKNEHLHVSKLKKNPTVPSGDVGTRSAAVVGTKLFEASLTICQAKKPPIA